MFTNRPISAILIASCLCLLAGIVWVGNAPALAQAQPKPGASVEARGVPCQDPPIDWTLPCEPVLISGGQYFVRTTAVEAMVVDVRTYNGGAVSFNILPRAVNYAGATGFVIAIPPSLPDDLYLLSFEFYADLPNACVVTYKNAYRIVP
jgi:hypothetical protein